MRYLFIISALIFSASITSSAAAQFSQQTRIQSYRGGIRTTTSAILSRPTVSPYLALADINGTGQVDTSQNYFTQVRPRLQRQEQQRLQQRQMQSIQQDMSALRSTAARLAQGGARATGHPTRFQTYLQYYPGLSFRR